MHREEIVARVRRFFNLNLYEAKIWLALLSRGSATAGELSDLAGVPRSRSYDILESLERKGLAVLKLGKPTRYIAIGPEEALERTKTFVKESAEAKIARLEELKGGELLKELNSLYSQGAKLINPSELSGTIKGQHNICTHLESLFKASQKSITLIATTGLLQKERIKAALEKAKKRGIAIRLALPQKTAKEFSHIGSVIPFDTNCRLAIIDKSDIFLMPLHEEEVHQNYDFGIWLKSPILASTLESLLEKRVK